MRRVALILASLCVAVAIGGCSLGGSSTNSAGFTGARGEVAVALNTFSSDASSNNSKDMCANVLDARLVKKLGGAAACQTIITAQLKTTDDFSLSVKAITLSGKSATASVQTVVAGKKKIQSVRLYQDAGGWRVDSLV
jgi:hypothetical protein